MQNDGLTLQTVAACRKSPFGAFRQILQSAARIICSLIANKFYTCSLKSIFRQVHALTENVFYLVFRLREKFCEAFSTVCDGLTLQTVVLHWNIERRRNTCIVLLRDVKLLSCSD